MDDFLDLFVGQRLFLFCDYQIVSFAVNVGVTGFAAIGKAIRGRKVVLVTTAYPTAVKTVISI